MNRKGGADRTVYIYGLTDPRTCRTVYIGQTVNPTERLKQHLREASHTTKGKWIEELSTFGFAPGIKLIEVVTAETATRAEQRWIHRLRARGYWLINDDRNPRAKCPTCGQHVKPCSIKLVKI